MADRLGNKEIDAVIAAYLGGSLSDADRAAFEKWLKASPDHPRRVARLSVTDFCLREVCEDTKVDYLLDVLNQIDRTTGPGQLVTLHGELREARRPSHLPLAIAATAAALLLGVLLTFVLLSDSAAPEPGNAFVLRPNNPTGHERIGPEPLSPPTIVATLTAEHDAEWDRRPGDDLYAGQRLTLNEGFAEITTKRGAIALLQAPTTIEFTQSDNALRLHDGKLVCICETESSKGFVVYTEHIDVTDLGTRFGIACEPSKNVFVEVLDGEVEVNHSSDQTPNYNVLLKESDTIALNSAGHRIAPEHVNVGHFMLLSREQTAVAMTSKNITVVPEKPMPLADAEAIAKAQAFIYEESAGHVLPQDVRVGITQAGRYETFRAQSLPDGTIPSGSKVRTYVIRAIGGDVSDAIDGRVIFDAPILGVMPVTEYWSAYRQVMQGNSLAFEHGHHNYLLEGLDDPSHDQPGPDRLTLDADMKTLDFGFFLGKHGFDHVRVFVAENPQEDKRQD